jgi:hypothetical protein
LSDKAMTPIEEFAHDARNFIMFTVSGFPAGVLLGQNIPSSAPIAIGTNTTNAKDNEPPPQRNLDGAVRELKQLSLAQPKSAGGQEIDRLKEQVDLQQKQIDVLLKMTQLLADKLKKQPTTSSVEKLQEQVATSESQIQRAAQRDKELARARDDLLERIDAATRNPKLPATLHELFLPTRTNESPVAFYGRIIGVSSVFGPKN